MKNSSRKKHQICVELFKSLYETNFKAIFPSCFLHVFPYVILLTPSCMQRKLSCTRTPSVFVHEGALHKYAPKKSWHTNWMGVVFKYYVLSQSLYWPDPFHSQSPMIKNQITKWKQKAGLTKQESRSVHPKSDVAAFTHTLCSVYVIWNQTLLIRSDLLPAAGSPAESSVLLLQICGISRKSNVSYPKSQPVCMTSHCCFHQFQRDPSWKSCLDFPKPRSLLMVSQFIVEKQFYSPFSLVQPGSGSFSLWIFCSRSKISQISKCLSHTLLLNDLTNHVF